MMKSVRRHGLWGLMLLGAIMIALLSSSYFTLDPDVYFPRQRAVYEAHTPWLIAHIGGMMFALLLGPFQFRSELRSRYPRVHRMTGRLYLGGAFVGAIGGLYMARYSASGVTSDIGFTGLGLAVLITSGVALWRIRAGNTESHREWMIRSYAMIFSAVTLRLYLMPLEAVFGEYDGYAIDAWACWLPNLAVAEWIIRRSRPQLAPSVLPA